MTVAFTTVFGGCLAQSPAKARRALAIHVLIGFFSDGPTLIRRYLIPSPNKAETTILTVESTCRDFIFLVLYGSVGSAESYVNTNHRRQREIEKRSSSETKLRDCFYQTLRLKVDLLDNIYPPTLRRRDKVQKKSRYNTKCE